MKHLSKKLRGVLAVLLIAVALVGVAAGANSTRKEQVSVTYRGIKMVVDGMEITPKTADGKAVEPFILNGTTYIPLRPLCNAMGYTNDQIVFDGQNNIIYIGKVPGADNQENWFKKVPVYQTSYAEVYDGSDPKKTFGVAGKTQTQGVVFGATSRKPFAIWNTDALYGNMTITVGHMGDRTNDAVLKVYLDGEYSTEYELKYDAAPKTFTIPLRYQPNVKFEFTGPNDGDLWGSWGVYDISFS